MKRPKPRRKNNCNLTQRPNLKPRVLSQLIFAISLVRGWVWVAFHRDRQHRQLTIQATPATISQRVRELFQLEIEPHLLSANAHPNLPIRETRFMELFRDRDSWQKPIEPRTETDRAIVTAKVDRHLRCVQLPREDTGVGISGEDRGKLFPGFEPWGARQRKARETGLELAISQQILQLMGEQSQVESELGWGSTFEVEVALPAVMNWVRQRSLDRGRKILGYEGVCRHLPIFDDRRVLVFRTVLIHLLESLGFEIDRVQNRCQGIENLLNQYSIEVDRRG